MIKIQTINDSDVDSLAGDNTTVADLTVDEMMVDNMAVDVLAQHL